MIFHVSLICIFFNFSYFCFQRSKWIYFTSFQTLPTKSLFYFKSTKRKNPLKLSDPIPITIIKRIFQRQICGGFLRFHWYYNYKFDFWFLGKLQSFPINIKQLQNLPFSLKSSTLSLTFIFHYNYFAHPITIFLSIQHNKKWLFQKVWFFFFSIFFFTK